MYIVYNKGEWHATLYYFGNKRVSQESIAVEYCFKRLSILSIVHIN